MKKLTRITLTVGLAFALNIASTVSLQAEPTAAPPIQKPTPASKPKPTSGQRTNNGSRGVAQSGNTRLTYTPKNKTFTVNGVSFTMVEVRGGTFTMGATPEQGSDVNDDEKPTHKVTLPSYYIGQTEVTQALWQAVMGTNPSNYKGSVLPVEMVSWDEAKIFISKLNELTGEYFRLPTEAEWEFAARGGTMSKGYMYSGSNDISEVAWFIDNSGDETHPVGKKMPNELGIYDMSGNVWEWCQDREGEYSTKNEYNPSGPSSGDWRIQRGGCYMNVVYSCRIARRLGGMHDENMSPGVGFRLAL